MDPSGDTADFDRMVRLHIYRRFVEDGRPPSVFETAQAVAASAHDVEAAYRRLAQGRAIVLHPGTTDVWMANPLSAVPTTFTVQVADRSYFGNCVWDALGVVAMLGGSGRVLTECPDCGEPLEVAIGAGEPGAGPCILHFAVPASHWWDDIGYT